MEIEILNGPGAAAAKIIMTPGETATAEAGAMIGMSGDMSITTTTHKKKSGSILKSLKRMLGGESFFMNHYDAGPAGGDVIVAATMPGDMGVYEVSEGDNIVIQGGSFVASSHDVDIDMNWQGFKNFLSGENLFWLKASGQGKLVFNSFGSIYQVEVDGQYTVDTGHIVAFSEGLSFDISKAGKSWISSFLGGEGLVCNFKGKGTLWCQSHNESEFGKTLGPMLRPKE
jgi:uncharacterized protein (TIGR00266 family)